MESGKLIAEIELFLQQIGRRSMERRKEFGLAQTPSQLGIIENIIDECSLLLKVNTADRKINGQKSFCKTFNKDRKNDSYLPI